MRIILVGYGEMASELLLGLNEAGHDVVGIFRWNRAKMPPIKRFLMDYFNPEKFYSIIKQLNMPEIGAKSINSDEFFNQALKLQPDIILVGSWGEILNQRIMNLPKIACINVHPSLLPKYRGPNPYIETIRNGEVQTGVSFHLMSRDLDAGPILMQETINISDEDTGFSLRTKCTFKARAMVKEVLAGLSEGATMPIAQNEEQATYFPRMTIRDAVIDWGNSSQEIYNQVRALNNWQSCYSLHGDAFLKFNQVKMIDVETTAKPGEVINKKNGLAVATGDKKVILIEKPKIYGFWGKLFGKIYIRSKINVGDTLKKF